MKTIELMIKRNTEPRRKKSMAGSVMDYIEENLMEGNLKPVNYLNLIPFTKYAILSSVFTGRDGSCTTVSPPCWILFLTLEFVLDRSSIDSGSNSDIMVRVSRFG